VTGDAGGAGPDGAALEGTGPLDGGPQGDPGRGAGERRPWFDQAGWRWRFDWGPNGLRRLAPLVDVVVVVDVLRFTTAVDVAVARGAVVYPHRWKDGSEHAFAAAHDAVVASNQLGPTAEAPWSLSPESLASIPAGTGLVLPSPNGSALCVGAVEAGARAVFAGCLRNASAVAGAAATVAGPDGAIAVIAAGERWNGATGPLRPALEDLLGAGAILASADRPDALSPEAAAARAAFVEAQPRLAEVIATCGSGVELADRGQAADLPWAADHDASSAAPRLDGENFTDGAGPRSS
jgi:2-phosphosulfolactate phosphatase